MEELIYKTLLLINTVFTGIVCYLHFDKKNYKTAFVLAITFLILLLFLNKEL
jgi:hypothetical protein